jgi:hypothetical protein
MRTALAPVLLLLWATATPAGAQEKVDLSAAAAYRPVVGDRVRCTRRERQVMDTVARQAGQPDQTKHEDTGYEAGWTGEVLEVAGDGKRAVRLQRRYESFRDPGHGEALAAVGAAPAPPKLPAGTTVRVDIAMDRAERRERVRP